MTAVLSLGSNVGDREAHLRAALAVLEPSAVSALYETAPVGGVAQDDFLNLVALVPWDAAEAWARAQRAEREAGRTREVRWGPRTLDIDVITYGDQTSNDPVLTLPHPRAATRGFVLLPWSWMEPEAVLGGKPVAELAAAAADAGAIRRAEAGA